MNGTIKIKPFGYANGTEFEVVSGDFKEALKVLRPLQPSRGPMGKWLLDHDDLLDLAPVDGVEAVYAVVARVIPVSEFSIIKSNGESIK